MDCDSEASVGKSRYTRNSKHDILNLKLIPGPSIPRLPYQEGFKILTQFCKRFSRSSAENVSFTGSRLMVTMAVKHQHPSPGPYCPTIIGNIPTTAWEPYLKLIKWRTICGGVLSEATAVRVLTRGP